MATRKTNTPGNSRRTRANGGTKGQQKQSKADRLSGGRDRNANTRSTSKGAFRGSRYDPERQSEDSGRGSTRKFKAGSEK